MPTSQSFLLFLSLFLFFALGFAFALLFALLFGAAGRACVVVGGLGVTVGGFGGALFERVVLAATWSRFYCAGLLINTISQRPQ